MSVEIFQEALRVGLRACRDREVGRRGLVLLGLVGRAFATKALAAEMSSAMSPED